MNGMKPILLALTVGLTPLPACAQQSQDYVRLPSTAENRLRDIDVFQEKFLAKDISYSAAARAEAETRLAKLRASAETVSQPAFDLELARIVALADNGHTHYVLGSIQRHYNRVPIRLAVFGEDFHVVRALDPDLLGAKLVGIDSHAIGDLRTAGRSLWGGEAAFRDRFSFNLLESPDLLNAIGLADQPGDALYRFDKAGMAIEKRLTGEPPSDTRPFSNPYQVLFPQKLPLEDASWLTLLAADKAPWALQDWSTRFRWRRAPELDALVIEFRQNNTANGAKIGPALTEFTKAIGDAKPKNLVIDMRGNGGGDLTTTRTFFQSLPQRVPGRIFVLTSPLTFSAAISSIGYLEQAAPERVVIVGEPVGDRQMFFSEGDGVSLPASRGLVVGATERHDYATGCRGYRDCHHNVVRHPISVASIKPDIAAPWTIEAYATGRDPAMEAVAAALR
jgi:hypothetical protein